MLEAKAQEKWGGQKDYEQYVAKTPIMFPWMPAGKYITQEAEKSQKKQK